MENKQLLENMSRLGYPLFNVVESFNSDETLAQVVKAQNGRYWEGFPVLLANVVKEGGFNYAQVEGYLNDPQEKKRLNDLFLLSLALYEFNKLKSKWVKNLFALENEAQREKVQLYKKALMENVEIKVGNDLLDAQRLKNAFQSYFSLQAAEVREFSRKHDELSLEYAFSQIFSLKQKELFNKKLKGDLLTKTEKEYFSRVVRKKVVALANFELHQLSKKILEI